MSSHAPYPPDRDEATIAPTAPVGKQQQSQPYPPSAAATAPAGKPQDDTPASPTRPPAQQHGDGVSASAAAHNNNVVDATEYRLPMRVEAMAAPPTRTIIEESTTTAANGSATPAIASASPLGNADTCTEHHAAGGVGSSVESVITTSTTTRVVVMQPHKIVYHYADHTVQTYVLQTTTTKAEEEEEKEEKRGVRGGAAKGNGRAPARQTFASCRPQQQQQQQRLSSRASAARIPDAHGEEGSGGDSSSLVSFTSEPSDEDCDKGEATAAASAALLRKTVPLTPCATCGHLSCLAAAYRPPEHAADITPANPRIGSPGPVTLFAFGFTTCLYNVHQAGICPMNLTTMGLICFYGGLAQFVGGFFELMNKNTIFCTLDVTYGAFWMATAITNLVPANAAVVGDAPKNYMGGFFMLWFFFAATMFASSFKFSYVQMLLNFSVMLNFFLNFLGSFIGSATLLHVAGFEGIVEGCLATYVGMAFTMRDIYGHSVLPLFFQKNFRITEW